jgi:AcrR family transcriptional regulator
MSSPAPAHRTQEQRRAETRAKLLDAAVKSVLEVGYAQTTVRGVSELAGVSAGAQAHHFPRRVDLFGATIEHLIERRIEEARAHATPARGKPRDRFAALVDLVWADFSSPVFVVFVKLWVAAVDEPELYQRLALAERHVSRAIADLATEVVGDRPATADIESAVLLVLSACRGHALIEHFEPHTHTRRDQWPRLRKALLKAIDT